MNDFKPYKRADYRGHKAVVADLYKANGGVPGVMALLGIRESQTYAFADDAVDDSEISFSRVCALTVASGSLAAAHHLALLGNGVVAPVRPGHDTETGAISWPSFAQILTERTSDLIGAVLGQAGEGAEIDDLPPSDRAELAGHMDVLIAELVAARRALQNDGRGE